jgi:hypothetical protein
MLEYLMKKILSFAIGALLIYVPKDKVIEEMAALPDMEQRVANADLKGWKLEKAVSERTGIVHYYYHLPSTDTNSVPLVCVHGFNTDGRVFLNLNSLSDVCGGDYPSQCQAREILFD